MEAIRWEHEENDQMNIGRLSNREGCKQLTTEEEGEGGGKMELGDNEVKKCKKTGRGPGKT